MGSWKNFKLSEAVNFELEPEDDDGFSKVTYKTNIADLFNTYLNMRKEYNKLRNMGKKLKGLKTMKYVLSLHAKAIKETKEYMETFYPEEYSMLRSKYSSEFR